jgi:predicted GNAT family acetyltransferase
LTHVIAPRPGPGSLRIATPDDTTLVVGWAKAFQEEALHTSPSDEEALAWTRTRIGNGEVYLWVLPDGAIVSLVGTTRPVSHVISIAPVYTPPELRGHGYASRSVAALSQHLLDRGWQRCSLFTDLSNPTSNSIYQQVGYRPVRDFHEYDFSQ